VVDTMARTMVGGDENAAKDVGRFVHAVDALRGGGAALVVHHTGHGEGERERGSSALGAAADARLQLTRDGRTPRPTLTNPKQKDAAEHPAIDLRLEPCGSSLVLSLVTPAEAAHDEQEAADELREQVRAFIAAHGPASKRAVRDHMKGVGNPRVDRALSQLVTAGRIVATGKGRGDGYEACPDPSGTLGHACERSPGGSVPGERETPAGGPLRDTLRDPDTEPCPDLVAAELADVEVPS
jgi:hypothetical protein